MTISELIEQLTLIKEQHGDLDVTAWDAYYDCPSYDVEVRISGDDVRIMAL